MKAAMSVEIINKPGQLPAFWNRSIIFFANIQSIFFDNQGGLERLKQQVSGVETY